MESVDGDTRGPPGTICVYVYTELCLQVYEYTFIYIHQIWIRTYLYRLGVGSFGGSGALGPLLTRRDFLVPEDALVSCAYVKGGRGGVVFVRVCVCGGKGGGLWAREIFCYGVATISRLLKIIGLLCRISSILKGSFAKETCNVKEPTNRN